MDMKEMMKSVLNDEAIVEKFSKCETAAEMQMLLEGSGIHMTEEEMLEVCCELLATEVKNGELSVDELDEVVGGNGMNGSLGEQKKNLTKLSKGDRVNSKADKASRKAIEEKMKKQLSAIK